MKTVFIIVISLALGFFYEGYGQAESTKILKFEIDGKEVKNNYKVFFRFNNKWIESKSTSPGFMIPTELKNDKKLSVMIAIGKIKLTFPDVDISKFEENWIVGIDYKPFSKEIAYLVKTTNVNRVYYIHFVGSSLETRLVVMNNSTK